MWPCSCKVIFSPANSFDRQLFCPTLSYEISDDDDAAGGVVDGDFLVVVTVVMAIVMGQCLDNNGYDNSIDDGGAMIAPFYCVEHFVWTTSFNPLVAHWTGHRWESEL